MGDIAIQVEGLSKLYHIGRSKTYKTARETVMNVLGAPARLFRRRPEDPSTELWALKDVSFNVQRGEVVGIIGRNGAGKSTLLKVLSRITEPTAGRIALHGRIGSLLEVGTGFHPELTGRENIFLNGAILGMRRAEITSKFDEIVAFSEVEKFLDTPVKHYSSGMYTRLAFAVAAHLEPEILVVDEVLAVGDAEFQKKCLGKMKDVAGQGRTVLFVSHNMTAVAQLCSSIIMLTSGRVAAVSDDVELTIQNYLRGGLRGEGGESQWVNPGSDFRHETFTPRRMTLVDEAGRPRYSPFSNAQPTYVEITGDIQTVDPGLNVGIAIYSDDGQLVYWSFILDQAAERWPKLTPGTHTFRTKIPERFLNEGGYRIELGSTLHGRLWLTQPAVNAPAAHFEIAGGLSDSPYYTQRRPGMLAPIMEWTTT